MTGPLEGIRVVEIGSLGPGPFAGMMLADHGAEVIRVEREDPMQDLMGPLLRSRKSVALDLKCPDDIARLRDLCRTADGLIEGFRPGVMERLGLGPEILMADNPKLVYGRMTGWGQDGPYAHLAGHDINYIALSVCFGGLRQVWGDTGASNEFARGLWWRRNAAGFRHGECPVGSAARSAGTGDRLRDDGWIGIADDDDLGAQGKRHLERRSGYESVGYRRPLLRRI